MTTFRWVIGAIAALMAAGALAAVLVFVVFDRPRWIEYARRLRRWAWLALLLWFNVEVWTLVLRTLLQ